MGDSRDDDNVNYNGDKQLHTNTRAKKKTAPIVVLGADFNTV